MRAVQLFHSSTQLGDLLIDAGLFERAADERRAPANVVVDRVDKVDVALEGELAG